MSRRRTHIDDLPESLVEKVTMILHDNGYTISEENKINYGYQLKTASGAVINMYGTGKVVISGNHTEAAKLKQLIK